MSIICELELRKSFTFRVAVATQQVYWTPRLSVIPVFLILDMHIISEIKSLKLNIVLFLFNP